jgi:hypothetical protein
MRSGRWILVGLVAVVVAPRAAPHEDLQEFVHHAMRVRVTARNIDVTVRLTFYGELARLERRRMDTDGNGAIDGTELAAYTAWAAGATADALEIAFVHVAPAGSSPQALRTMLLYEPAVGLHEVWEASEAPVTVTLHYFARTPARLAPGAELQVDDALWLEAPAISITRGDKRSPIRVVPVREAPARFNQNEPRRHAFRLPDVVREDSE